jgi:ketosteroid isomerase-like protein
MKVILATLLMAVAAFAGPADQEINAAVEAYRTAMLKGDAAALDKLYHADLTYEHSSGKTETKAEAIAAATKPGSLAKNIVFQPGTVRVYGNTGIFKAKGDFTNAAGETSHLDVLMVFVKVSGKWQLVARQSTKITV